MEVKGGIEQPMAEIHQKTGRVLQGQEALYEVVESKARLRAQPSLDSLPRSLDDSG